ncbi:nuclease A inhibitor family protein [Pedobacter sp. AW1-32]|uniref:nuclease A inhibitor family protein n=1 Tax=Pedobacter sp. AW1-32 TaxID=3383026 RepID=UPI003FED8229
MSNIALTTFSNLLAGVLYFSESENPFTVSDWGKISPSDVHAQIAMRFDRKPENLKTLQPDAFFERIVQRADPSDHIVVEHAQKLAAFYQKIRSSLSNIQVTRVEGNVQIPILITGHTEDGTCVVAETLSIET